MADGALLDDALLSRGSEQQNTVGINRAKILIGVAVVAALLGAYGILSWTGALTRLVKKHILCFFTSLRRTIRRERTWSHEVRP